MENNGIFGRKKKLSQAGAQVHLNDFKVQLNLVIFVHLVYAVCAIVADLRVGFNIYIYTSITLLVLFILQLYV
jgi:hypothetical protein